ncbi:MAG: lycopene cyclase family protein, partial [Ilumatobacteraceae bacterium]
RDTSTVRMASGTSVEARLVVDATGSRPVPQGGGGAQTAFGLTVDSDTARRVGVQSGVFTLMDWSQPPTFLYGAPFADGSVLLEETSLYAHPPRSLEYLEERLRARLGREGATTTNGVERVTIPMGGPLPDRTRRVVAFGASAGYVHPVTGYSVAASLRAAPRVAEAIRVSVARQQSGNALANATWDAVWPAAQLRTRAWHTMGLDVLQSLPDAAVAEFFDAFFSLPMHQWSAYLRVDATPRQVRQAMLGVFRGVGATTRFRLMSSPGGLLRAIVAR